MRTNDIINNLNLHKNYQIHRCCEYKNIICETQFFTVFLIPGFILYVYIDWILVEEGAGREAPPPSRLFGQGSGF